MLVAPPPDTRQLVENVATPDEQKGFWGSLWDAVAKPPRQLGEDIAELTPDVKNARASVEALKTGSYLNQNLPREVLDRVKTQNADDASKLEMILGEKPTTKRVIGDVVGTALEAIPLPISKIGLLGKIGSPFLRTAIEGGGYVAAFNAADAASDNKSAAGIAEAAGLGFLAGTALGGVGYLGSRGFVRLASLKPVQSAFERMGENETVKLISQYVRPVASVLSRDFGSEGKIVVDRLLAADRNVQGTMGRIMRVMEETGSQFGKDDAGREAAFQLGKALRGGASDVPFQNALPDAGKVTGRLVQTGDQSGAAVVSHGTTPEALAQIRANGMNPSERGIFGKGVYFTNNESTLATYGDSVVKVDSAGYKMKTFKTAQEQMAFVESQGFSKLSDTAAAIEKEGVYDGFVIPNPDGGVGDTSVFTNLEKLNSEVTSVGSKTPATVVGQRDAFFGKEVPADLKNLSPEQFYRALFGDISAEAQSRGIQIRVPASGEEAAKWTPFKPLENYFPKQTPPIQELEGRLRPWVIRNAVEDGKFATAEEAAKALDGYIEFVKKEGVGVSKTNGWVDYMVRSGQAENTVEAERIMKKMFEDQSLVKLGGSLEHARVVDNPFYNPFPDEVAPLYAMDSLTRLETIEQFGVKYSGQSSADLPKLTQAIDEVRNAQGGKAADKFRKFLDVAMNRINNATDEAKFVYYMRMSQVPKLSFAQIVNVGQSVLNPLLKTDARATFMGLYKAFTNDGVSRALESGATIQSVFNEMTRATAAGGNMADKWLKATGFIWTEKFNRTVSSNIGIEWAAKNFERLLRSPEKLAYKTRISELGIDVEAALKRGKLSNNDLLRAAQVMAEKTQFRSRPLDLPIWASSNAGKLFWQFKNFMYNQFMFVVKDNLVNEIKAGNYGRAARNVMVLGTVFPMGGEVLQDIRSLVTQTRRPTNALERYVSDLSSVGSMALISDVIDAVRFDKTDQLIMPTFLSSLGAIIDRADTPLEMFNEILKQTGVGAPIANVLRKRTKGRASTLESIGDLLNQ